MGHWHLENEHKPVQKMPGHSDGSRFRSVSKRQIAEPKVAFQCSEDLGEDNNVVITCGKLELWMLNEL